MAITYKFCSMKNSIEKIRKLISENEQLLSEAREDLKNASTYDDQQDCRSRIDSHLYLIDQLEILLNSLEG